MRGEQKKEERGKDGGEEGSAASSKVILGPLQLLLYPLLAYPLHCCPPPSLACLLLIFNIPPALHLPFLPFPSSLYPLGLNSTINSSPSSSWTSGGPLPQLPPSPFPSCLLASLRRLQGVLDLSFSALPPPVSVLSSSFHHSGFSCSCALLPPLPYNPQLRCQVDEKPLRFITPMGRAIYQAVLDPPPYKPVETFLPGRMAFLFRQLLPVASASAAIKSLAVSRHLPFDGFPVCPVMPSEREGEGFGRGKEFCMSTDADMCGWQRG